MFQAVNSFGRYKSLQPISETKVNQKSPEEASASRDLTGRSRSEGPDTFTSANEQDPNLKSKHLSEDKDEAQAADPELAALAQELGYSSVQALQKAIDSGAVNQEELDKKRDELAAKPKQDTISPRFEPQKNINKIAEVLGYNSPEALKAALDRGEISLNEVTGIFKQINGSGNNSVINSTFQAEIDNPEASEEIES